MTANHKKRVFKDPLVLLVFAGVGRDYVTMDQEGPTVYFDT